MKENSSHVWSEVRAAHAAARIGHRAHRHRAISDLRHRHRAPAPPSSSWLRSATPPRMPPRAHDWSAVARQSIRMSTSASGALRTAASSAAASSAATSSAAAPNAGRRGTDRRDPELGQISVDQRHELGDELLRVWGVPYRIPYRSKEQPGSAAADLLRTCVPLPSCVCARRSPLTESSCWKPL